MEPRAAATADERARFLWVVEGEGVQLTEEPEWSWGHDSGRADTHTGDGYVRRDVSVEDLPAEHARWLGRAVRLFDLDGKQCQAKVTGFRLVGRAQLDDDTIKEVKRLGKRDGAERLWEIAGGQGHALVATVDNLCATRWARDAALGVPEIVTAEKADPALRKQTLAKLKALHTCKEEVGLCDAENVSVVLFHLRCGGKKATLVWAVVNGHSSCDSNGFAYSWWLEDGGLKAAAHEPGPEVSPSAAVDLDGDGRPELLFQDGGTEDPDLNAGLLSLSPDKEWNLLDGIYFPFIGCPC